MQAGWEDLFSSELTLVHLLLLDQAGSAGGGEGWGARDRERRSRSLGVCLPWLIFRAHT